MRVTFVATASLLIALTASAFATESTGRTESQSRLGTASPVTPMEQPDDDLEEYFKTPEGKIAKRILRAIERGDNQTAAREYRKGQQLYGWKPKDRTPKPYNPFGPPNPYLKFNNPLVLPPEARH